MTGYSRQSAAEIVDNNIIEAADLNAEFDALAVAWNDIGIGCGNAGGTANTITLTPSPAITGYVDGQSFRFTATNTNSGATTINVSSQGAVAARINGAALEAGSIISGRSYMAQYNGSAMEIFAQSPIAPASTTDGALVTWSGTTGQRLGSGVSISTLLPTGAMFPFLATTAPSGFVRANGRTIGNASSSATERANADCSALFTFLWTNFSDTVCPVSSGRGANAAADFAANKTIQLVDLRGRGFFGLDDMGNSAASRITNTTASPNGTTNGASGGTQTHALTSNENGPHTHTIGSGSALFVTNIGATNDLSTGGGRAWYGGLVSSTDSSGTGAGHNNMSPFMLGTWIIKL